MTGSFQIRFGSFSPGFGVIFGMSTIVMQWSDSPGLQALQPMQRGTSRKDGASFAGARGGSVHRELALEHLVSFCGE